MHRIFRINIQANLTLKVTGRTQRDAHLIQMWCASHSKMVRKKEKTQAKTDFSDSVSARIS